jgi:hypothetical protein
MAIKNEKQQAGVAHVIPFALQGDLLGRQKDVNNSLEIYGTNKTLKNNTWTKSQIITTEVGFNLLA